jgi:hypothetical protein
MFLIRILNILQKIERLIIGLIFKLDQTMDCVQSVVRLCTDMVHSVNDTIGAAMVVVSSAATTTNGRTYYHPIPLAQNTKNREEMIDNHTDGNDDDDIEEEKTKNKNKIHDASELVDLAVNGLVTNSGSKRIGGALFESPKGTGVVPTIASDSLLINDYSFTSTSTMMTSQSVTNTNHNGISSLDICREEESKLLNKLTVALHPAEVETIEENRKKNISWFLVEAGWWRAWTSFLKGSVTRPGEICNANLLSEDGSSLWPTLQHGDHFVAMDKKSWGIISDIYGADVSVQVPYPGSFADHIQSRKVNVKVINNTNNNL